ncbi:MAG: response regulator, partial [Myxococcota bacterium]|nr:response regulator [Myxococcota bacterium]
RPIMNRPLRVLMIEDSSDDAALLLRELRRVGYDPTSERVDTRAGLERALDASWEIILCDYRMPGLDAPAAVAVVRGRQIDTPCIIVSGTVGEEHAVAALRSGAQDFVLKDNLTRLGPAIERELRDSEMRLKHAYAERTLRATEASFRGAFELIPDGVLVSREGLVVHANGSAAAMLGAPHQDDLIHRSFVDLFAPSDQRAVRERLGEVLRSNAAVPLGELTMIRLDGHPFHVETTAMSVLFDGQPAVLGVVRDVSARRELVARTMQVDRMLAVGTIAAGVGHEINNPLAYVMANVAYASDEIGRAQRQLEKLGEREPSTRAIVASLSDVVAILAEVDEGAHRIRDIARDLNTFARDDEELRLVDLRAVADSALRMAAPEIRQRARVIREYGNVPAVRGSASRLSQVLLNLVINAAQSITKGAYDANAVTVRIRSEGAKVIVEVCDTGCGITPEHSDRLFTPFFTTKPVGQGTGLGLSISKRIVRSLGGDIDVESIPGAGTTMRVVLPAVQDPTLRNSAIPGVAARRGRLLFVDDERLVGIAFQRAVSREHDVVLVETAADALSTLAAGESFDAIFCDVNMPMMTGEDLYEAIERTLPGIAHRVIMITGGGHAPRTKEFVTARQIPLLEKPLDMKQVRLLLAQRLSDDGERA